jgi:hypothetical protein
MYIRAATHTLHQAEDSLGLFRGRLGRLKFQFTTSFAAPCIIIIRDEIRKWLHPEICGGSRDDDFHNQPQPAGHLRAPR